MNRARSTVRPHTSLNKALAVGSTIAAFAVIVFVMLGGGQG